MRWRRSSRLGLFFGVGERLGRERDDRETGDQRRERLRATHGSVPPEPLPCVRLLAPSSATSVPPCCVRPLRQQCGNPWDFRGRSTRCCEPMARAFRGLGSRLPILPVDDRAARDRVRARAIAKSRRATPACARGCATDAHRRGCDAIRGGDFGAQAGAAASRSFESSEISSAGRHRLGVDGRSPPGPRSAAGRSCAYSARTRGVSRPRRFRLGTIFEKSICRKPCMKGVSLRPLDPDRHVPAEALVDLVHQQAIAHQVGRLDHEVLALAQLRAATAPWCRGLRARARRRRRGATRRP